MRAGRYVPPWERHCGCPTCHAKPRERCLIVKSRYPGFTTKGTPTNAHLARIQLYEHLFKGGAA